MDVRMVVETGVRQGPAHSMILAHAWSVTYRVCTVRPQIYPYGCKICKRQKRDVI